MRWDPAVTKVAVLENIESIRKIAVEHDASDVLICKQDVPILLTMVAIFAETSVEWRGRLRKSEIKCVAAVRLLHLT